MSSAIGEPQVTLEARRDVVDVSTSGHHVPDPGWSHTDSHGHEHRFVDGELPTLHTVVTNTYWCDSCSDEHQEEELRCRDCEEKVEPRWKWSGEQRITVPGLAQLTATILYPYGLARSVWLTQDEFEELHALDGAPRITRAIEIADAKNPLP